MLLHLPFDRGYEFFSASQIRLSLLPLAERSLHPAVQHFVYPLLQGHLAALLKRVGDTHALVLGSHELVSFGAVIFVKLLAGSLE